MFELVGVKGDLGALFLGALLAGTQKSKELSRRLIQFKDLFLVCFFLSIGLSGWPTEEMLLVAILLGFLVMIKPAGLFSADDPATYTTTDCFTLCQCDGKL